MIDRAQFNQLDSLPIRSWIPIYFPANNKHAVRNIITLQCN